MAENNLKFPYEAVLQDIANFAWSYKSLLATIWQRHRQKGKTRETWVRWDKMRAMVRGEPLQNYHLLDVVLLLLLQCTYVSVSVLSHPIIHLDCLQKDSFQLLLFIKFSLSFFEKPRINRLSQIKVDPWYSQGLGTKTVNTWDLSKNARNCLF